MICMNNKLPHVVASVAQPIKMDEVDDSEQSLIDLLRQDSDCVKMLHSLMHDMEQPTKQTVDMTYKQDSPVGEASKMSASAIATALSLPGLEYEALPSFSATFQHEEIPSSAAFQLEPAPISETYQHEAVPSSVIAQSQQPTASTFPQSKVKMNPFFFVVSRGGFVLEHAGNRCMRGIINQYAETYIRTRRLERGRVKNQVFDLCKGQFEFVIQKSSFLRYYAKDQQRGARRQFSNGRIQSILDANGGLDSILACQETDYVRVGDSCAIDVVGHLLRDAANELRRSRDEV
jgi:hypothetical protein